MASKKDWLDAGLTILADDGVPALTIERLMGMLGLTKGSFYHHFGGMPAYKTALLDYYEKEFTTSYVDAAEAGEAPALTRLERLVSLVASDDRPDPEIAIRAWAAQDDEVNEVQRRIDRSRMAYLRRLWEEHSGDADEAKVMSQLLYFIVIGAGHVVPAVQGRQLRRLYQFALSELPERSRASRKKG